MKKGISVCALFIISVVFPVVAIQGINHPLMNGMSVKKVPFVGEQIEKSAAIYNYQESQFAGEESKLVKTKIKDAFLPPYYLDVQTEGMPPGHALFTWLHASDVDIHTFRYDDGVLTTPVGYFGDKNSILGAVHHNDASLSQVSWYLTGEGGPHNFVKIWVLGLDEDGAPNRNDIIYTADNVPNTDNQWSIYTFENALILPNGFFIGISYEGFLGIGLDDGIGEPWEFQFGTQFGIFDITDGQYEFTDVGAMGLEQNLMLRGVGINHGDIYYAKSSTAEVHGPLPVIIELDEPIQTYKRVDDSFIGFDVFLNGEEIISDIQQSEWLFTGLDSGIHEAGVRSV